MRVKKVLSILLCALFALNALLPGGEMLAASFEYRFELANYTAFAFVTAVISVSAVILSIIVKEPVKNRAIGVLTSLLAPLSLINIVFYGGHSTAMMISSVSVGCSFYLSAKYGRPLAHKVICLILSCLMILPISFFGFVALMFADTLEKEYMILRYVPSPQNGHYAEVLYSDHGALGGDTFVDIYENGKAFNAVIFKISKKPERVYLDDDFGISSDNIFWKNEYCLVVGSVEYELNIDD